MSVLIFGASGQLGQALLASAEECQVQYVDVSRKVEVGDEASVMEVVKQHSPLWVINAAAMTNVDKAHTDVETAMSVNGRGAGNIASASTSVGARFIQISTEAVFDGKTRSKYVEDDACSPVSVYGVSKLAGEHLSRILCERSYILRTSWLYSGRRGMNFPTRLLSQLHSSSRAVPVVTDVIGNPTPTGVLARAIFALVENPPEYGTYHVCSRDSASKFEWATEIAATAGYDVGRIIGVSSDDYPTPAKRPKNVDLDASKFIATGVFGLPDWREAWASTSDA